MPIPVGQLLPADEVLQHGALPCALTADHRDLRQVQVAGLADGAEGILQLVDQRDQILHATISHGAFCQEDLESANGDRREVKRRKRRGRGAAVLLVQDYRGAW